MEPVGARRCIMRRDLETDLDHRILEGNERRRQSQVEGRRRRRKNKVWSTLGERHVERVEKLNVFTAGLSGLILPWQT